MQVNEVSETSSRHASSRAGLAVDAVVGLASGVILLVLVSLLASLSLGAAVPQVELRMSVGVALSVVTVAACAAGWARPRASISAGATLIFVGLFGQLLGTSAMGADGGLWPILQFGLQTFLVPVLGAALVTLGGISLRHHR
ncbi:hypothetical protein [Agromyces marinus]|uniref:Histidinol dehydrogenase n=1 Tax=Agromyces marinus TaxID=1389020 RepID=A0ABM8GX36_9MICO|nr:hypothetical protein [Agromyces marinus]UIP58652.1 hypothetical protein DSM26151_15310 [Agromyces marinus]BDZ53057.1 hypothetical protein GCM10025870_01300 [Agromyces marinus]